MATETYNRVNWKDSPSTETPINQANLNKMDKGIKDNNTGLIALENDYNSNKNNVDNQLTANNNKFQFDYDSTTQRYGYRIGNTFYPFDKGAIYLGEYSANTTIDVSALGATSVNQFILCSPNGNFQTRTSEIDNTNYTFDNTVYAGSLSLSGNTLSITVPRSRMQMFQEWADPRQIPHWDISMNLPCKVYYVDSIH